jgi:hypothetical protein
MALTSPGVQVSVIDESFYTPAEPGTTPMIFVVSAQDKKNASGTGTATGTTKANAGKPFLLTSQRDLADTFGDPVFETDASSNAVHAGELNEYGLQAAYSYLGVSNAAWVTRADIDTNQLKPSATAPAANPVNGAYWFDVGATTFGLQEWNAAAVTVTGGQSFTNRIPSVITSVTFVTGSLESPGAPKTSYGTIGDYAVVAITTLNTMWYKTAGNAPGVTPGTWVQLGSEDWMKSWPTVQGSKANPAFSGSTTITLNGVSIAVSSADTTTSIAATINGLSIPGILAASVNSKLEIYSDGNSSGAADSTTGGPIIVAGDSATLTLLGITAGTYYPPALQVTPHTSIPEWKTSDTYTRPTGSVWFKTTEANKGARFRVKSFNSGTVLFDTVAAPLYATNEEALYKLDLAGGGANLAAGALYVQTNVAGDAQPLGTYKIFKREAAAVTTVRGSKILASTMTAGAKSFTVASTDAGKAAFNTPITVSATFNGTITDADTLAAAITSANIENVTADVDSQNRVTISHSQFGDIRFVDTDGSLTEAGFTAFVSSTSGTPNLYYVSGTSSATNPKQLQASQWKSLAYTASENEISALTAAKTLWYNSVVDEVDLMIHNGTTWVGYLDSTSPFYEASEAEQTDPAGPIVSASTPILQSDGTALKHGDVWVSTATLSSYPQIYVFNANKLNTPIANRWELRDSADQTTENGVLFADARWATAGSLSTASDIDELLTSNFLDADAPEPALYPKGMLLWNLRRSGFNVKRFERNWVNVNGDNARTNDESMELYYPHRWVTESGNQADGSGSFGAKAQRKVVVQGLQSLVNSNQDIRDDESRLFNLMATPGYPELIGEMITLNYDRGLSAFIVGDSPATLPADATSLNNWATNTLLAPEDNADGLVSRDEYMGMFYPWGFSSDNGGNNVVIPPSHMMLRTIALSDQVSFPWFAPAGIRRGGITNATSTGFVNAEGEFNVVSLNEGQRDTLYAQNVNPITFITGAGLVAYGQKTRARGSSALDRINVARLVIYLRSQLSKLAKPYIFEPNDKITRDEIKGAAESLLLELVGQRALYDFLVVCDESNNTPARIDRNELYLDIAIEPVKAVEFIYIPLRLKNTGEIAGL